MEREDKELLLKDLCARLPYGVNVEYTFKVTVIATNTEEIITKPLYLYSINTLDDMTVSGIDNDGYENICFFEEIKPYLFPLSSMTEEQKREYNFLKHEVPICHYEYGDVVEEIELYDSPESFEYLIKNHFDYRGLIPMGIAIDATGKNIY